MITRKRIWEILEIAGEGDRTSRIVDFALFFLVGANVLAIILESVPSIRAAYKPFFYGFELISVVLFTIEYLLRVWSSVEDYGQVHTSHLKARLKFMASSMALIDLAAIAPFYLQILLPGMDLRFLRVLRMLRILKITRYSSAMNVLLRVLHKERQAFGAVFTILAMVLIMVSCGIYLVESKAQPEAFGSIPDSMWWALATLTTVGFGDVTPITPLGKFFGALVMIIGIGIIALPAGILASSFSEILRRRQQEFRLSVKKAMEDGEISEDEADELNKIREQLNLTEEDSDELQSQTQKELDVDKRYEVAWEKQAIRDVEEETGIPAISHPKPSQAADDHLSTCPHCGGKI